MQSRKLLTLCLSSAALAACSSGSNSPTTAVVAGPARNTDGSVVSGVQTARFDPSNGVLPFPTNLLFNGSTDVTLNPPVVNPNNFGDPAVALSALDGFSTNAPWTAQFSAAINPASVIAGQTVRMFEVTRQSGGIGITGFVRELAAGSEFVTALSTSDTGGRTLAIVPTRVLEELKTYLVIITKGIKDTAGNDATPDSTYFLTKRPTSLVNITPATATSAAVCASSDPLLPAASACALEPLRQLTNSQEAVAASRGINVNDIVLSFSATTQAITPVSRTIRALMTPQASTIARTPLNIGQLGLGLPAIADVYIGITPTNYYLTAPGVAPEGSAAGTAVSAPSVVLTGFWRARPNGYVAPFNTLGLDPTSTNVTFANPVPVRNSVQQMPLLMTVPNAASGQTRPAAGWPIVVFQHGITRNRTDMLAVSATFAAAGWAVVAVDIPLHGVDRTSPFYIEATPFGPISNERTFDVDLIRNVPLVTAPGATPVPEAPDGLADPSGAHSINLGSLLTSRDNNRQGQIDLVQLFRNVTRMDIDGNGTPDFDPARIAFTGTSLGAITGIPAVAIEPTVSVGVYNVPGGGIARFLNGSPTFGPRIRAGLAQLAGLQPNTPSFDQFFLITQTVIDSADPLNYARLLVSPTRPGGQGRVLLQEVVGTPGSTAADSQPDQVIPNTVAGAPLSGTEPLIATMGLTTITASVQSPTGIRGVVRFIKGDHGSLLSPANSAAATVEMQTEMASMVASGGTAVTVSNTSVIKTN